MKIFIQAIDEDVDDDEDDAEDFDDSPPAKKRKRGSGLPSSTVGRPAGASATRGRGRGSRGGRRSDRDGGESPSSTAAVDSMPSMRGKRGRRPYGSNVGSGATTSKINNRFQEMLLKLVECVTDYRDR